MLACCSPKLNWMPKNPTFMFTICQNESVGRATCSTPDTLPTATAAPATCLSSVRPVSHLPPVNVVLP
jgi:hypothetical protein